MSCSTCKQINPIPCCVTTLTVGTVADASVNVRVYFKNITTGRILGLPGTTDGAGLVTVDVSDEQFATNQSWEIWVTLTSTSVNERLNLTVNSATVDCLATTFIKAMDEDETILTEADFTISL